jgi:hypothetical protein
VAEEEKRKKEGSAAAGSLSLYLSRSHEIADRSNPSLNRLKTFENEGRKFAASAGFDI